MIFLSVRECNATSMQSDIGSGSKLDPSASSSSWPRPQLAILSPLSLVSLPMETGTRISSERSTRDSCSSAVRWLKHGSSLIAQHLSSISDFRAGIALMTGSSRTSHASMRRVSSDDILPTEAGRVSNLMKFSIVRCARAARSPSEAGSSSRSEPSFSNPSRWSTSRCRSSPSHSGRYLRAPQCTVSSRTSSLIFRRSFGSCISCMSLVPNASLSASCERSTEYARIPCMSPTALSRGEKASSSASASKHTRCAFRALASANSRGARRLRSSLVGALDLAGLQAGIRKTFLCSISSYEVSPHTPFTLSILTLSSRSKPDATGRMSLEQISAAFLCSISL
mmetsp:Transcript_89020/g.144237  ORF Transcript_89020/g.144237 Transcript_89020/m.144237 type:complete len:339 (+) Transcript_89020:909-1925(+)